MAKKNSTNEIIEENVSEEIANTEVNSEISKEETKESSKNKTVKSNKGVVVNCSKLFVRNKPNKINSMIVTVIPVGTEVTVEQKECENDFYKVSVDGYSGYCAKPYIRLK